MHRRDILFSHSIPRWRRMSTNTGEGGGRETSNSSVQLFLFSFLFYFFLRLFFFFSFRFVLFLFSSVCFFFFVPPLLLFSTAKFTQSLHGNAKCEWRVAMRSFLLEGWWLVAIESSPWFFLHRWNRGTVIVVAFAFYRYDTVGSVHFDLNTSRLF